MHSFIRHLHGGDPHSHAEAAPQTTGRLIHWAKRYDLCVQVVGLGQAKRLRRMTIDLANVRPGERILDVGCGTGDLTLLAQERVGSSGQAAGIDASPEMIDVARRKAARARSGADFRLSAIERMPFPDGAFDVVFSSLMMHHLPDDLQPQALAEVRRVITPGGRLVIVDFKQSDGMQSLATLVKAAGFNQVASGDLHFLWLGLGFVKAS